MSGYFAVDPSWWAVARSRLPLPWLQEEALIDLRYWQDQALIGASDMPGARTLAEQWGWGHKKVRLLMQKEELWSDPAKLTRWRSIRGHTEGTPRAHEGHTEGTPAQEQTPNIDQSGHTEGTPRAHRGHTKGHTREPISTQTQTQVTDTETEEALASARLPVPEEPEQGKDSKGKAKASAERRADFSEAVRVWDEEIVPAARKAGATIGEHPRLDPGKGLGKALRQRLDGNGLEAVLTVFRWYAASTGARAAFLREGGHELATLTRASKFEEYLGFARAEAASTQAPVKVGRAAHDAPPPDLYVVTDDERAKLREAKAAAKAAIEAERLALEAKQQRLAASLRSPR